MASFEKLGELFAPVLTLGIDTSTPRSSVAIARGREILAEVSAEELGSAEALTGLLAAAVAGAGCGLGEIERIALCLGPGSFTGVRTGLASAYGLSLGLGAPVFGVSVFASRLFSRLVTPGSYLVHLRASRQECFWTLIGAESAAGGWRLSTLAPPAACGFAELEEELQRVAARQGVDAVLVDADEGFDPAHGARLTALTAQLACGDDLLFQRGGASGGLTPLYIKAANAKTLAERSMKC